MKYVWLNIHTGKFSNSWDEQTHQEWGVGIPNDELIKARKEEGVVLLKYECLNDPDFELYNQMKLR